MNRQHFALAPRSSAHGWVSLSMDGGPWCATGLETRSLESVLVGTFAKLRGNPLANFTFSAGRHGQMLVANSVEEQPSAEAMRQMVPRASITVLVPISSPHYPELWVHCWRDPRGGLTLGKRFNARTIIDEAAEWFAFFGPSKIENGRAGVVELWLRRDWSAFTWFGEEAFPAPKAPPVKPPPSEQQAELKKRNDRMRQLARIKERRAGARAR